MFSKNLNEFSSPRNKTARRPIRREEVAMPKTKQMTPKQTKKASAKSAKGAKSSSTRAAAKKTPKKLLSADEKLRLIKPIDGFTEIAERFAATWKDRQALKVAGLSPAKLLRAIESAKKAAAKENALRAKLEEKLRPLTDARLLAEHEAWKMVLDAYAVAKALARVNPEVGHAFTFVGESMTNKPKKKAPPAQEETPPPT
jgi:hypothetical protein